MIAGRDFRQAKRRLAVHEEGIAPMPGGHRVVAASRVEDVRADSDIAISLKREGFGPGMNIAGIPTGVLLEFFRDDSQACGFHGRRDLIDKRMTFPHWIQPQVPLRRHLRDDLAGGA